MKLSITTLGCMDWSLDKIVDYYESIGIHGIEIRGINGVMMPAEIDCFKPENEQATKVFLADHKMKLVCFDTNCGFDHPEKLDAMITEGKDAIDICVRFGIPYIRVFGNEVDEDNRAASGKVIADGIRILTDYARTKGVKVLLETHGNICTIENVKAITDNLKGDKNFGILWDVAHSDRYYGPDIEEFYTFIKHLLCHVHFKDHFRLPGHENKLTDIGKGEIPLAKIIGLLKDGGYNGYISFEHEKKWHPELADAEVEFPMFVEFMKQFD